MTVNVKIADAVETAVLDAGHIGHIHGAFGTILHGDVAPRATWKHRLTTLLAILGPGLIVMVGDNDAGAFATYGQVGQNYGTTLLWTLALLIPVLYVNQEMVLRLGAVTGVGHARLIFERFGKFWGAFSVIDLFLLNALTIVTEFIGISLALDYLGLDKATGVIVSAALIMVAVSTGDFRRFERFAMVLVGASFLLVPIYLMVHPPMAQVARDFLIPQLPERGKLSDVMLLIIGIVGTTVAPWQLFFQQSYVVDKRITPRFIRYEKVDLWIGIVIVVLGAGALMGATAAAFAGTKGAGNFTDAAGLAHGIAAHAGRIAGAVFAVALLDAAIIGAFAVSLSTAYAVGDTLGLKHSLHRGFRQAKGFYAIYAGLIAVAAAIVLMPHAPLGLVIEGVQALAGVLLPAAAVFLLLLCNDRAVLGPWVNNRGTNIFTSAVITVLVALSVVLTASVLHPGITDRQILDIVLGCVAVAVAVGGWTLIRSFRAHSSVEMDRRDRETWRMPPLNMLSKPVMSAPRKIGLTILRSYLAIAMVLVIVRLAQMAIGH